MISANVPNVVRKMVYRRDNYACALCNDPRTLQIHHYQHRSLGGNDTPHNLITLCSYCHALIYGVDINDVGLTTDEVDQAVAEYLADLYAPTWWPFSYND